MISGHKKAVFILLLNKEREITHTEDLFSPLSLRRERGAYKTNFDSWGPLNKYLLSE